ncbi:AraC family transcriptional regulator [Streptomyces sp. NPDC049555]|uniref:AraC family transcriptional regulator n=1 Tax=Streptomyces sp. NPDC049555 TaxID=3154930 RepID=UPI003431E102
MLQELNRAMDHIEEHLDGPLDVADLARIAMTSEYHFRRLFSALAGLPLSEYVRRRRLTVAGAEVLAGERTLLDVAVRYGYGSAEAFARAFRGMHGVGPGEARRNGAALHSQPRMSFRLIVEGNSSMRYRIVEKNEFQVVGAKARLPLVHLGPNPAMVTVLQGIDPQTRQQLEELAGRSQEGPGGLVSVCDDLDPSRAEGTEFDFYFGAVTNPADDHGISGTATLTVPAGTWAVFEHTGPYPEALQYLWRDVFTQWFPSNPYLSRPGPEILRTVISPDGTEAEAELWIPVERAPAV